MQKQTLGELIEKNLDEVAPEVRERLVKDIKDHAEESNNSWLKDQFKPVEVVGQLLLGYANTERV